MQPERIPVYHRNGSCGSSRRSTTDSAETLYGPKQHPHVRRCYLERKLFDAIHNHILGYQDVGHLHELQMVSHYYQQYFPEEWIEITVAFEPHTDFPFKLVLQTVRGHPNNVLRREEYIKRHESTGFQEAVRCEMYDHVRNKTFEKIQTFAAEIPWTEVPTVAPPAAEARMIFWE